MRTLYELKDKIERQIHTRAENTYKFGKTLGKKHTQDYLKLNDAMFKHLQGGNSPLKDLKLSFKRRNDDTLEVFAFDGEDEVYICSIYTIIAKHLSRSCSFVDFKVSYENYGDMDLTEAFALAKDKRLERDTQTRKTEDLFNKLRQTLTQDEMNTLIQSYLTADESIELFESLKATGEKRYEII